MRKESEKRFRKYSTSSLIPARVPTLNNLKNVSRRSFFERIEGKQAKGD